MTVAALPSSIDYLENGATLAFAVPFRFKSGAHVAATRVLADGSVVTLTHGTSYTVSGGTTDSGGTLTLGASVAGATLRLRRVTPRAQSMDYTPGDTFPAESHELAIDTAMLIDQEQDVKIADTAARALMVPDGFIAGTIASPAANAGKFVVAKIGGGFEYATGPGADSALRSDLANSAIGATIVAFDADETVKQHVDATDATVATMYPVRGATLMYLYGDSVIAAYGATVTDNGWGYVYRAAMGGGYLNRGIPGGSVKHIAQNQFADPVAVDGHSVISLLFNDYREGGATVAALKAADAGIRASLAWAAVADSLRTKASQGGVYAGTWTAPSLAPYGFGRYTIIPLDTITFTVTGRAVYVWVLCGEFGGKLKLAIDGNVYEEDTQVLLPDGAALGAGPAYQPMLVRIGGLGDGDHACTIQNVSASGATPLYVLGWAGSAAFATAKPLVVASSPLRMSAAGYAGSGPNYNKGTAAVHRAYAAIARKAALDLIADGANIVFVDAAGAWDPVADPAGDGIHPDDSGHASIADAHVKAMRNRRGSGNAEGAALVASRTDRGKMTPVLFGAAGTAVHTYTAAQTYNYWKRRGDEARNDFQITITALDATMVAELRVSLSHKVGVAGGTGAAGVRQGVTLTAGSAGIIVEAVPGTRYAILRQSMAAATNLPETALAASAPTPLILSGSIVFDVADD